MMEVTEILSNRYVESWASWHLVHELEDDFANWFNIPIKKFHTNHIWERILENKIVSKICKNYPTQFLQKINAVGSNTEKSLIFDLSPQNSFLASISTHRTSIPIIIDYFKTTSARKFYDTYKNCELVLISNLEAYDYLLNENIPLNIKFLPLSISDKYKLTKNSDYQKIYDIVVAGRGNKVLDNFLSIFCKKYNEVEILYQKQIGKEIYYESNKKGVLGKFSMRSEYINLLRSSKIAFYSTPGIDGGEIRTGGFNPVTPRFFELLSSKCLLLGRYPDNVETRYFELNKVCPNIDSYEDFERYTLSYLSQDNIPFNLYDEILSKHYTSVRAKQLADILASNR